MKLVILQPTMDTLKDFHGTPPWINFPQCYHLTIKSTTNSFQNERPLLASYVQLRGFRMIRQELGRIDLASIAWIGV